ncbi:MAG: protein kinase [Planctomycetota bacterium]
MALDRDGVDRGTEPCNGRGGARSGEHADRRGPRARRATALAGRGAELRGGRRGVARAGRARARRRARRRPRPPGHQAVERARTPRRPRCPGGLRAGDSAEGEPALSLTGSPIGTPHYMAPEQAELSRARVDERTDVYGFGAMLYEVLCQQRPYEGESVLEVLDAIRHREPRPLRAVRRSLGDDAEAVCERAMQRDPDRRYGSADALLGDLRRLASGQLTEARRSLGGPARRFLHRLGASSAGGGARYTSSARFLGFPLLEVVSGARAPGAPMPTAVAWLAIGPRAIGAVAIGGISVGGIALGGIGLGLVALGGLAFGGIAGGGTTIGARAFGGIAVGDVAVGGLAVGRGALGGLAIGKYAIGGNVVGAEGRNEEAQRFFREETFPLEPLYAELLDTVFAVPPVR